jgi:two-component system, OmpR family, KDP operon response regulator KdpE
LKSPEDASTPAPLILIVEDEPQLVRFLRATLADQGYRIALATTGKQALAEATMRSPDLVLLDLGLPDIDGLEVTRQIRQWSAMPIIVVSARGKEPEKVEALDAGADDYLTKPFGVGELLARVRVALRHVSRVDDGGDSVFEVADLRLDLAARRVTVAGTEVHLTPTEYKLLTTLAKHAGKVLTHRQLLLEVWGPESTDQSQYLRVYMGQLRHKIEKDPARPRYILTEVGVGYRLQAE